MIAPLEPNEHIVSKLGVKNPEFLARMSS